MAIIIFFISSSRKSDTINNNKSAKNYTVDCDCDKGAEYAISKKVESVFN